MAPIVPWHYLTYPKDCHFDVGPLLAMGWRPTYSNAEMLPESYDWYCANHDLRINGGPAASPHRSPLRQGILRLVKKASGSGLKAALRGSRRPRGPDTHPIPPKTQHTRTKTRTESEPPPPTH